MPRVLILGGNGYLGLALGQALLRSGNYSVFGTVRTAEKAKDLTLSEITPLQGDATDSAFLTNAIDTYHIDTIIDTTQAYYQAGDILKAIVTAAKARASKLSSESFVGPKLGFIYTSGSWVHGSPNRRVSDLTVPGVKTSPDKPATAVGWRPAHEQAILAARDVLDVAIIRPGSIYGRKSWVWSTYWSPILKAAGSSQAISIPTNATARMGVVHVDDLAEAFVNAVSRLDGQLGNWPIFDVASETLTAKEINQVVAHQLGAKGEITYAGTMDNPFLEALGLRTDSDFGRSRAVLGWTPRRNDFIGELPVLVQAWKAAQE